MAKPTYTLAQLGTPVRLRDGRSLDALDDVAPVYRCSHLDRGFLRWLLHGMRPLCCNRGAVPVLSSHDEGHGKAWAGAALCPDHVHLAQPGGSDA